MPIDEIGGRVTEVGGTPHPYVWPSEMDVMAKMAGLEPVHRYADLDKSPFTAESKSSVSVWRKT